MFQGERYVGGEPYRPTQLEIAAEKICASFNAVLPSAAVEDFAYQARLNRVSSPIGIVAKNSGPKDLVILYQRFSPLETQYGGLHGLIDVLRKTAVLRGEIEDGELCEAENSFSRVRISREEYARLASQYLFDLNHFADTPVINPLERLGLLAFKPGQDSLRTVQQITEGVVEWDEWPTELNCDFVGYRRRPQFLVGGKLQAGWYDMLDFTFGQSGKASRFAASFELANSRLVLQGIDQQDVSLGCDRVSLRGFTGEDGILPQLRMGFNPRYTVMNIGDLLRGGVNCSLHLEPNSNLPGVIEVIGRAMNDYSQQVPVSSPLPISA